MTNGPKATEGERKKRRINDGTRDEETKRRRDEETKRRRRKETKPEGHGMTNGLNTTGLKANEE